MSLLDDDTNLFVAGLSCLGFLLYAGILLGLVVGLIWLASRGGL